MYKQKQLTVALGVQQNVLLLRYLRLKYKTLLTSIGLTHDTVEC